MNSERIPLMRPTLPDWDLIADDFRDIWSSGLLTSNKFTRRFEDLVCKKLNVAHAVAVSSCTSGLMLVFRALELRGEVIMPSFTWVSTALAATWNGLVPVFADCVPDQYTLDPEAVRKLVTKDTAAVMAVNVFGLYPDMDALREICREKNIPFLSDSAQGIGAADKGRVGGSLADVEIFSLSPTKVVTAVEGGLVTTNDARLAEKIRLMRDYGKSPDAKDIAFHGLSARMSEFHAAVALHGLERLDDLLEGRRQIFRRYREGLKDLQGMRFQEMPEGCTTSGNYFIIFPDPKVCPRETLVGRLDSRGVSTKRYFYPPVHKVSALSWLPPPRLPLPVTEEASERGLALPIFTHMEMSVIDRVCAIMREEYR